MINKKLVYLSMKLNILSVKTYLNDVLIQFDRENLSRSDNKVVQNDNLPTFLFLFSKAEHFLKIQELKLLFPAISVGHRSFRGSVQFASSLEDLLARRS